MTEKEQFKSISQLIRYIRRMTLTIVISMSACECIAYTGEAERSSSTGGKWLGFVLIVGVIFLICYLARRSDKKDSQESMAEDNSKENIVEHENEEGLSETWGTYFGEIEDKDGRYICTKCGSVVANPKFMHEGLGCGTAIFIIIIAELLGFCLSPVFHLIPVILCFALMYYRAGTFLGVKRPVCRKCHSAGTLIPVTTPEGIRLCKKYAETNGNTAENVQGE